MTSRRIIAVAAFGLVGMAILLAMGVWQVQRLGWKTTLISEIEERLAASPVALPDEIDRARDRLLRVAVSGRLGQGELHVISSLRPWGAGYRVVSALELGDGRRVLVDRGFVPVDMKEPANRSDAPAAGDMVDVTGLLLWPAETDSYTPEPDLGRNIWFARDVDAMAEALGTAPVMIVAESAGPAEWPRPVPPGVDVPNRHLEYAITWFGLAVVWGAMTLLLIRGELRGRRTAGR